MALADSLAPLHAPPVPSQLPSLPSLPARQPALSLDVFAQYELTTHIFPAAYPRSYPAIELPALPSGDATPEERKAGIAKVSAELLRWRLKYVQGELADEPKDERLLWTCANRYRRRSARKGITLVLCHANGFTKESWEPVIDHVISTSSPNLVIEEVWCLESVQHGDSALLNDGRIGALFDWKDQARDILHFLQCYLPESSTSLISTHLPRLPDHVSNTRAAQGFSQRIVVGAGHSVGGVAMLFAALAHPALFRGLVSLEAVVRARIGDDATETAGLARVVLPTLGRRSAWPSLAAARADLTAFPLFRTFAARQVGVYLDTALHTLPDGRARLKQDPRAEAVLFERAAPIAAWELAPLLSTEVRVLWVRGARPSVFSGPAKEGDEFIKRVRDARRGIGCEVAIVDGGHLIVQENPQGVADVMRDFLERTFGGESARL